MGRIFTKRELKEKLGMRDEDIKIIMKFQKLLPILSEDGEGFCVDGRTLYKQLKISKNYSSWMKSNLEATDSIEGIDYEIIYEGVDDSFKGNVKDMSPQQLSRNGITKTHNITIDIAKEISMITGASSHTNKETKHISKVTRKYFIIMEKTLRKMLEWERIREPEKTTYKEMCEELRLYRLRNFKKETQTYHYSNEANALNLICLGARAKDIREYLETNDKNTRDHLFAEYNHYLSEIQKLNTMYLRMNMDTELRHNMIQQGFKAMFPNATYVKANKQIEENREHIENKEKNNL